MRDRNRMAIIFKFLNSNLEVSCTGLAWRGKNEEEDERNLGGSELATGAVGS